MMPEVTTEKLEHLEHQSRRLQTLLVMWSAQTGDDPTKMLATVDDVIAKGITPEFLHRYAARCRRKK
jgi:hypothetical protein